MIHFSHIAIPPSDAPAAELPDVEPTSADLLAIETADDDHNHDRVVQALWLAAHEHTHRELMALRHELTVDTEPSSPWRAVA